jgi:hypothetical protein
MRLTKLKVKNSITDEVIRIINFNEKGLSLIVDGTNSKVSGSNIGKTTAVKVINLCLGARSVSSLYKEKDTGENHQINDFLNKNKVVAELECIVDNTKYTFKRCLYKNGKSEINGEKIQNYTLYISRLNEIIFKNQDSKPTFRQLITKFIRLETTNENALLKYLGDNTTNYGYQAIYGYLFGINLSKSKNLEIINLNQEIEKEIKVIYKKNGVASLEEFDAKINLMREQVEKFRKEYSEVTVIDEYKDKLSNYEKDLQRINALENKIARGSLKIELMEEKISKEKDKITSVDHKALEILYGETKELLKKPLREFKELEEFHNGMIKKRIGVLEDSLNELFDLINSMKKELESMRRSHEREYINFNCEIKEKFEEKYNEFSKNNIKLENYENDYNYILEKNKEKGNNLDKKIEDVSLQNIEEIKESLKEYFKELTNSVIGEAYTLVFNDESDEDFPIKIIGMNGNPGTGIKKAMIMCFDLAFIKLIIEKKYHMPIFEIHDKLENIDLNELRNIIKEARKFDGQYIFPILNDRIEYAGIKEEEIVLRLSSKDKFFKV